MLTDARQRPDARLLVVEDEPNILELLSASLRYAGFAVATAASGAEAVKAARPLRPDLVVLDVMLPDLDGFEVARRLRINELLDAVRDRHRGAGHEQPDRGEQRPHVGLPPVTERVRGVGRAAGPPVGDQEEDLVAGVRPRMRRLGQQ